MTTIHITYFGGPLGLIFDDVDVSFRTDLALPQLTAQRLDPDGARDHDHSIARLVDITLAGVQLTYFDLDADGEVSASGQAIITGVRRYPTGHGPTHEEQACRRCAEPHPVTRDWLPPTDETIPVGVQVEFQIGHEPDDDDLDVTTAAVARARHAAQALVARGHDPECTTGSGPCERCAKRHAGQSVIRALDGQRP